LPVTIAARGSYRLTSNLSYNPAISPLSSNFIEITVNDVQLDLNGFSIVCRNVLTGTPCRGATPLSAESAILVGVDQVRIRNGIIGGMPGNAILGVNGAKLDIRDLTVRDSGRIGIEAGFDSHIESCTVADTASTGIVAPVGSSVIGNIVRDSGGDGYLVGSTGIVRNNVARSNGGSGFRITGSVVVQGNTSTLNSQHGFRLIDASLDTGGLARDNVANRNSGFGLSMGSAWGFTDNVAAGNNGGNANPQTSGGIAGSGNFCGASLGCP
jgi:hypothetical protein